ncbi:MAG: L-seryl-tRNA(Sec) selenium transferase [Collinsella sp.]
MAGGEGGGETCDAVHAAVTAELDEERAAIRAGAAPRSKRELASAIEWRAHPPAAEPASRRQRHGCYPYDLGRALLAESAAKAVAEVARGYSTLEYSVDTCSRGSRKEHAAQLIRSLTGAEDALVVNNNAAAVLLVLATHAAGKEVIVSRGELVEIGGSFRIPDVMEASGAKLVEVGATNRTHLSDYERAITPDTAMILKVHPSNYRIEGFHEEVGSRELAALAHKHGLLFYEDQGSGAHLPDDILVRGGEETTPASVSAGLDLVSCSGDKLLGAAQAGIIMGRRNLVQACGSHPLMRALRPGKLALSALEATLRIYMDGADVAHRDIPVLSMLTLPQAHLERRARKLRDRMVAGLDKAGCPCAVQVEIVEESSTPGGGSLPTVELPTMCVAVYPVDGAVRRRAQALACPGLRHAGRHANFARSHFV